MIFEIGTKIKLREDSDKSDWNLSDIEQRLQETYEVKEISVFSGSYLIEAIESSRTEVSRWETSGEFLRKHFYPILGWKERLS